MEVEATDRFIEQVAKLLKESLDSMDLAIASFREDRKQLVSALGHLETAAREMRDETASARTALLDAPKALRDVERPLRQTIDLLHGLIRSGSLTFAIGVSLLVATAVYGARSQQRLLRSLRSPGGAAQSGLLPARTRAKPVGEDGPKKPLPSRGPNAP